MGDGAVAILAGRPADVDVTTSLLDHVKIPGEVGWLLIGEGKRKKEKKKFLSLNCVSNNTITGGDKLGYVTQKHPSETDILFSVGETRRKKTH